MDKEALQKLSYGVFVVTACADGKHNGCIINTVMQVTSNPEKIVFAINKNNYTHDILKENKKVNISVLSEMADFELIKRFGFQSGRDIDKFEKFSGYKKSLNDLYYITDGTNAYISAWIEEMIDFGSHTLFVATVTYMEKLNDVKSATYEFYHSNIKPKPEKREDGKSVYRCKICGYEYEGEELPADYICPLCKHPAADFEKVK